LRSRAAVSEALEVDPGFDPGFDPGWGFVIRDS
jgi:hypothetical protein